MLFVENVPFTTWCTAHKDILVCFLVFSARRHGLFQMHGVLQILIHMLIYLHHTFRSPRLRTEKALAEAATLVLDEKSWKWMVTSKEANTV